MPGQLAEPVLSLGEGLRQGPPIFLSVHPWGRTVRVGHREELKCSKLKQRILRVSQTDGYLRGKMRKMKPNTQYCYMEVVT
jgi:hypothetical protein